LHLCDSDDDDLNKQLVLLLVASSLFLSPLSPPVFQGGPILCVPALLVCLRADGRTRRACHGDLVRVHEINRHMTRYKIQEERCFKILT